LSPTEHDVIIRPVADRGELDLFRRFPYPYNEELDGDLDDGHRRLDWLWMALRGGELLARAGWWERPAAAGSMLLDIFDLDDDLAGAGTAGPAGTGGPADTGGSAGIVEIAARLLREAMAQVVPPGAQLPHYHRNVPADWRDQPASRHAVENRMAAVTSLGGRLQVERYRLMWRPGTPIPERSGRLRFTPVSDEDELIGLMTQVLEGTLDAHDREELTRMSAREAATGHFRGEMALFTSPREWWQVARLPDGTPVGFVVPANNGYSPIISYIAVLPAHRGHGYINEILAEGTRILAAADVPYISASTDLGNTPMAAAFHRAGWTDRGHEIVMTWA
jgi:RimJ/RimL family protein N-acetyltransferase